MPGRFPFPRYPNGWFQVAYSDELAAGAVQPLTYFGRELVLFRGASGAARVLDAHCPHMGAHLGHGGEVVGDCVRCPFHAWEIDGEGACARIPYAEKIPPRARLRSWPCVEKNGLILIWHHAEGAPPAWEVPTVEEYGSDEWTAYERRRWKIRTHNQEMAENAVDCAHFFYVHGTAEMPSTQAEIREHVLHVLSTTKMTTPMGKVTGSVESISHGFGFATTRFRGIVETLLVTSVTPIDDDFVDTRFAFTVRKLPHKDVTRTVGRAFIAEIERQLEQDIPIWENKRYVSPPLLCDGDGPIGMFRKWARQFYGAAA
jgi:phenylpropionate dioxygenase-like ring-hydroxylating dioxygenase large terminal subunit